MSKQPFPLAANGRRDSASFAGGDVEGIGRCLHNRLQEAAEKIRPEVADYQRCLQQCKPAGARMSGSGSTLFALARDREEGSSDRPRTKQTVEKGGVVFLVRSWS